MSREHKMFLCTKDYWIWHAILLPDMQSKSVSCRLIFLLVEIAVIHFIQTLKEKWILSVLIIAGKTGQCMKLQFQQTTNPNF
ncbi:hypothetical protein I3843_07G141200 [Carya illinoinensis]|nr:hypothetical protein I3843_07G141200 [Carya illinoinensis]